MQFTILGTTVIIIRDQKEAPLVHRVRTPDELAEMARLKALQLQVLGDIRTFY